MDEIQYKLNYIREREQEFPLFHQQPQILIKKSGLVPFHIPT